MGYNARLNPQSQATGSFASIATNSSSHQVIFSPVGSGQIVGARFINGATSSVASGTTAASAMNVYVLKNEVASASTASIVASSRLGVVATLATATLAMGTATGTANVQRFVNGDVYVAHIYGGIGNNRNNAGCVVQVDYVYGHSLDGSATP